MTDHPNPVVIATFINAFEAEMAQSALEAAGIESTVRGDDCGGVQTALWVNGIQLMVDPVDVERAKEILERPALGVTE